MRLTFSLLVAAVATLSVRTSQSQDSWLGQPVFLKDGATARVGTKSVDLNQFSFPATVEKVEGEWMWLGRAWVKKRDVLRTDEALTHYTDEIRREPSKATAWQRRGSVWDEKGEVDSAIKDYTEAIRLDPAEPLTYNNRGTAWIKKQEVDNAIHDFTEAIKLDPTEASAHMNRGGAWHRKHEHDNAIKDYTEAIRLDPAYSKSYSNRGEVYWILGDFEKAARDFRQALIFNSTSAFTNYNLGVAEHLADSDSNAVTHLLQAIESSGTNEYGSFFGPGQIRGQFKPAPEQDSRGDPLVLLSQDALAWILATSSDGRVRDGGHAVKLAAATVKSNKREPFYLDTLAAAYAETGDFDKAVEQEQKAIELVTDDTVKTEFGKRLGLYKSNRPYREDK